MNRAELLALADRVEALTDNDNRLDVQAEVALFEPKSVYSAVRANSAGSKVIYTDPVGNEVTCWAMDWTANDRRSLTAAALRAKAEEVGDGR